MTDPDGVTFLQDMLPRLGLRWTGFRKVRRQVCKRLQRRLRDLDLPDLAAYLPAAEAISTRSFLQYSFGSMNYCLVTETGVIF